MQAQNTDFSLKHILTNNALQKLYTSFCWEYGMKNVCKTRPNCDELLKKVALCWNFCVLLHIITSENMIQSYDEVLDAKYGAVGTEERDAFRKEAYAFYMGQVIREARREEKITQKELGKRIGANKSYISRIENGLIDPTISTLYSIINALGLRIEIVRPLGWKVKFLD